MTFSYQRQAVAWVRLFAEAPLTGAAGYVKGEASMGRCRSQRHCSCAPVPILVQYRSSAA